jgi:hypothetical protein
MIFASIPSATAIFLDANTLVYHFSNEPKYGPACTQLIKRVELRPFPVSLLPVHWRM